MTRDLEGRLAALEATSARAGQDAWLAEYQAALEELSVEELYQLGGEYLMGYAQVWCTGFRRRLDPRQLAWAPRRGSGRPR